MFAGALAVYASGCGPAAAVPEHHRTPVDEQTSRMPRMRVPTPRLIAPPPAYGNKIVMAGAPHEADRF